jgi:xanthine dehydrogenase accessory factor
MNGREFFERIAELERARTPFALATVVVRQAPVSSHLGDRAIVYADGRMQGFVGGSCSRDIVRRQAVAAMRSGTARLVQIRPGAAPDTDDASPSGTVVVPMNCASEGAVDVYVEPHLPPRILLVAGFTPVAGALARLTGLLDEYRVVRVVATNDLTDASVEDPGRVIELAALHDFLGGLDAGERAGLIAVVASQGNYDEDALEGLLVGDAPAYVGLVASRKRAAEVFGVLGQRGVSRERLERVHNPAGLDIGARLPGDVAISILAEIIATASALELPAGRPETPEKLAGDPVCGMDVDATGAAHRAEHAGQAYYFCCAQCCATFLADPQRYATVAHS